MAVTAVQRSSSPALEPASKQGLGNILQNPYLLGVAMVSKHAMEI
jgi:hypothetical protein